jgi:hypothetical protein
MGVKVAMTSTLAECDKSLTLLVGVLSLSSASLYTLTVGVVRRVARGDPVEARDAMFCCRWLPWQEMADKVVMQCYNDVLLVMVSRSDDLKEV